VPIAVVVIVHQRRAHLRGVLARLAAQDVAPGHVVVVRMDDRDPVAVPPGLALTLVDVARQDEALPLAAARNAGAHAAGGADGLVFLDVDCLPALDLVAAYGAALDERPGAIACGSVGYLPPGPVSPRDHDERLRARARTHAARPPARDGRRPLAPELLWSLSFACTKAVFGRLEGFDEGYVGYGAEDTDLGFRAAAAGVPIDAIPGAWAYHQHHPVSSPPYEHLDAILANATRFHTRWGRWPMEGWLAAFARDGLIAWEPGAARVRAI
jgi:GT2 family glycosyltransferase